MVIIIELLESNDKNLFNIRYPGSIFILKKRFLIFVFETKANIFWYCNVSVPTLESLKAATKKIDVKANTKNIRSVYLLDLLK